jgi:hypothetical protein
MAKNFKPVRRAQLISPFGVGAIVDFPRDEALMTAGLDVWPYAHDECPSEWKISEERLQGRLGVSHFRLPPDFRFEDIDSRYVRQEVPYVRFPRWHFCPAYGCGQMVKRHLLGGGVTFCQSDRHKHLAEFKRPRVVPVRFVAICPHGHIEDFPFMEWVHRGKQIDNPANHQLRYRAGRSAALSGIVIECSCGARENMGGAFSYESDTGGALHKLGYDCRGDQPWLGITDGSGIRCNGFLRAVQRGASNVYFAQTYSSIYLPLWGEKTDPRIVKALEDPVLWESLSTGLDEGKYISSVRVDFLAKMRGLDQKQLQEAAQRKLDGGDETKSLTEEGYRRSEYEAFRTARGGAATDLLVEALPVEKYADWLAPFFERICLIRKLRETRVLSGFSRLLPPDALGANGGIQPLRRSPAVNWLPALVVKGEGIFFEFKNGEIKHWIERTKIADRIARLESRFNNARLQRTLPFVRVSPKFVLIHSFAHLLVRQLTFDCGYGSASLRERIYCDRTDNADSMQGVLIYTAAGDSEGTLGGLVRAGEPGNLEPSIRQAIRSAIWCSSDPVCGESVGQGSDGANLAACHGCTLLPETSCEEGNRLLDRATISGTPGDQLLGFFSRLLTAQA